MMHSFNQLCAFCHLPLADGEGNDCWPFIVSGLCCDDCDDSIVYPHRCVILTTPRTSNDKVH
jgi:hypothetical protein